MQRMKLAVEEFILFSKYFWFIKIVNFFYFLFMVFMSMCFCEFVYTILFATGSPLIANLSSSL